MRRVPKGTGKTLHRAVYSAGQAGSPPFGCRTAAKSENKSLNAWVAKELERAPRVTHYEDPWVARGLFFLLPLPGEAGGVVNSYFFRFPFRMPLSLSTGQNAGPI